jgi:hypothetical protein
MSSRVIITEENAGLVSSNTATPTLALAANVTTRTIWFTLRRDSLTEIYDHVLAGAMLGSTFVPFGALSIENPNLMVKAENVGTLAYCPIAVLAVTNSPDVYVTRSVQVGG